MESRQRHKKAGRRKASSQGKEPGSRPKTMQDSNRSRREQYRDNPQYREAAKERSRQAYRKKHPKTRKVVDRTQATSSVKEVIVEGLEHPAFIEVCTIPESAVYLGKTQLTLKRWIRDRLLPPPILVCTTSGYKHYSMGELQLISKVLREHEKNYEYLHYTHDTTVQNLWQRIEGYRKSNI